MAFDLDDEELRATRKVNGVEWEEDIKILETFRYRQKTKNYNKITLEDVQAIENLIARNKELESELNRQINVREINEKFIEDKFISKEIILDEIKELDNMKVDGEVFTTAVNFAKKILQELLNKGE